ncbi:MAG: SCP2 sterol-binding domain-containing protein [Acidimicrobiales bacterium]|nr:SCP2 sterol-binding domain-containing protein [Acidimicrobiales bacterium]
MTSFPFLSDEWMAESKRIRDEYRDRAADVPVSVRMNQVVKDVPFGDGVIHAHIDTSSGQLELGTGHLESPDLTVTLGYETARAILVDGDAQAALNAFMSGRIKVDGDITKMLALQTTGMGATTDPTALEIVRRIQAMTA